MEISRRDFFRYCSTSAAALGLSALDLGLLEKALAGPDASSVIWLQGSGCYGCSMSFLNRVSTTAPMNAADALKNSVKLVYHPALMGAAGEAAVAAAKKAATNPYVLVVEGGIPTAFDGAACWAWTWSGKDVTFQEAVKEFADRAAAIISVGTCAAFGGIPAAAPNPTEVKDVRTVTGKSTINVSGCPPHPDWIVWTLAECLINKAIPVDSLGRPKEFYGRRVHSQCPREDEGKARTFGADGQCLERLGCRGPETRANCPKQLWNGGTNFCIEANAPCLGCTEPTFPGAEPFYTGGRDDQPEGASPFRRRRRRGKSDEKE